MTNNQSKQSSKEKSPVQAIAQLRFARIAPRKMRLIAHMIKDLPATEAQAQLLVHARKSADPILKLLNSALSNAKEKKMNIAMLVVKEIRVDKGPMLKRWMPRAQGRATPIHKVTSHIYLALQESKKSVQSRFITQHEKPKKTETKGTPQRKAKNKLAIDQEKEQEQKTEIKTEAKTQEKGFTKKTFRRKSV